MWLGFLTTCAYIHSACIKIIIYSHPKQTLNAFGDRNIQAQILMFLIYMLNMQFSCRILFVSLFFYMEKPEGKDRV